jgi:hypothetical protein
MGESRIGPLAALVVMLLIVSGLGPALSVAAAPTLPDDVVQKATLTESNDRMDYNFTARDGEWSIVGINNYQGDGVIRHGLRANISSKNPIAQANAGSIPSTRSAGVIAVNGHDLPGPTIYTVSEELALYSPSFAMQLRRGMTTLSHNSQTVTGNMGADGVVVGFEIMLFKRDTLDLRLRIPPEWTYNYHFSLLLFSPTSRYHQYEGSGGMNPVAVSDAGENSEQALTYLAMDPGTYLVVLLNEGTPDQVRYELEVGVMGLPLDDGETDDETLTRVNEEDYYSIIAPSTAWSAAVVKARGVVDQPFTHSLHWPTPDSNTIAFDTIDDTSPGGIIAINGRELTSADTYYIRERYDPAGEDVAFTVQFARSSATLPPNNATTSDSLTSTDIFMLYEIRLQGSQTADFRLRVADTYTYDHDLGLYVFPPGDKYYSISGQLPEYAGGPVAMSRAGLNTEQDVVFTAADTGIYAIAIVNFATRDTIPFTLEVTIQGKSLVDDAPMEGDLNAQNREDLFQFVAQWDEWNVVGSRVLSPDGTLSHKLHSTALDTNPIREEEVGQVQIKGGKHGAMEDRNLGLLAIDGHELSVDTTYFIREEVSDGEPIYSVEFQSSHRNLAALSDNMTSTFQSDEFLHTYTVDLAEHDTIDLRVSPPKEFTYNYQMAVYVLGPGSLYRNLGTEGDAAAFASPGMNGNPSLVYTATTPGQHLIVVANVGPLGTMAYELTYAINGFPTSTSTLNKGLLDPDNSEDAFNFDATFGAYTLVVVRLPEVEAVAKVTATIRWPSIDSVALSTLTLDADDPVGAFVIDGDSLPAGSQRHYVHLESDVPDGRTVAYQVQIATTSGGIPNGAQNLTDQQIGSLFSPTLSKGSTIDMALRVPADYTYAYDLGLFLFAPDTTYMSTSDPEDGPRSVSRYGPGTEQEVVYTSGIDAEYAVVVLNHATLNELTIELGATVDGRPMDAPARGYVDPYNRNEQYRFTVTSDQWSVLAGSYVSGGGVFDLKLLTNGLSTNPVATRTASVDEGTGVIAINGWELDEPEKTMFANVSHNTDRAEFVVHGATDFTDFGAVGHMESGQFGEDEIAYVYHVDLSTSDHLEIQLAYDQGNWSSDVLLDLFIFEPNQVLGSSPITTITLKVTEGKTLIRGDGFFLADKTGTYGFVLVNRGPLGPMGFSMGIYTRSVVNQPPMYPAILKASTSTDKITITWAPNAESDFKKYEIYLSNEQGNLGDRVDTLTAQSLERYTIERLDPGHKYYITLVVHDEEGLSTSSNPYPVKTDDLPIYAEPWLWVIVLTIVIAFAAIVGIDWFIKRQKAKGASASEAGAAAAIATPGEEVDLEVEGIEESAPERRGRGAPDDETTRDRREAVDFMRQMMGDEED